MNREVRLYKDRGRCSTTGKKMFNQVSAAGVAREQRRRKDSNHHAYHCHDCHYWHVGSSALGRRPKTQPATPWQPLPIHLYEQKAA